MTARPLYLARATPPRAGCDDDGYPDDTHNPTIRVHADDDAPQYTGLVTEHEVPNYRVTERAPVGFCRD